MNKKFLLGITFLCAMSASLFPQHQKKDEYMTCYGDGSIVEVDECGVPVQTPVVGQEYYDDIEEELRESPFSREFAGLDEQSLAGQNWITVPGYSNPADNPYASNYPGDGAGLPPGVVFRAIRFIGEYEGVGGGALRTVEDCAGDTGDPFEDIWNS
jgi:hypothetical protein